MNLRKRNKKLFEIVIVKYFFYKEHLYKELEAKNGSKNKKF